MRLVPFAISQLDMVDGSISLIFYTGVLFLNSCWVFHSFVETQYKIPTPPHILPLFVLIIKQLC